MASEFAALMEPVARFLLGEPNARMSSKNELRYGSRGSLSIDIAKGTWFDNEAGEGGGLLDLITRETKLEGKARFEWLHEHGFEVDDEGGRTNGKDRAKIAATYDYCDEAGKLLFQVVRFEPKDFRQRKPDTSERSGWSWSVKGVRQVPYRLPELTEALAQDHTVFVVEGEKDVENLRRLGVPATCNAGGVGKWKPDLTEFFGGADVVIIPDYDPQKKHPKTGALMFHDDGRPILPGQDHAQAIAAALDGTATRVRVLELWKHWPVMPLKGDVSDWIKAGGTADVLYAFVERVPDWTPGGAAALLPLINIRLWHGVPAPDRRWVVHERIPDINVTLLTGQGGVGKTLLMQQLAAATVLSRDWIGVVPELGPVLFLTAEDDENELHFRYQRIAEFYGSSFNELADGGLNLLSLAGKDSAMAVADARGIVKPTELFHTMVRTAREIRPRWVGLDTAADIFVVNERDRSQVRQCISLLRGVALEINTAVILLAHPSLSGISSGSGLSGSTAWNNSVRSRLYLKTEKKKDKDEEDENDVEQQGARILEFMKSNYSALAAPVKLVWREGLLVPEQTLASLPPIDRAALEQRARDVFLALLTRYNRQDRVISYKERANNFAPNEFANQPEAKALHNSTAQRKKLLRQAMDYLLAKERIHTGFGPKTVPSSKQRECLYAGGTLL